MLMHPTGFHSVVPKMIHDPLLDIDTLANVNDLIISIVKVIHARGFRKLMEHFHGNASGQTGFLDSAINKILDAGLTGMLVQCHVQERGCCHGIIKCAVTPAYLNAKVTD